MPRICIWKPIADSVTPVCHVNYEMKWKKNVQRFSKYNNIEMLTGFQ